MLTLVSDLFLTDAFLIKGNVENKYTRLSKLLDEHRKYFLRIRDVTLIDLNSRERITTPLLHMNVDEVLVAHEFLDEAGDGYRAEMAAQSDDDRLNKVRVFYTGNLNVEIAGEIRANAYEISDKATRRFFVMREPKLRGFKDHGDKGSEADLGPAVSDPEQGAAVVHLRLQLGTDGPPAPPGGIPPQGGTTRGADAGYARPPWSARAHIPKPSSRLSSPSPA